MFVSYCVLTHTKESVSGSLVMMMSHPPFCLYREIHAQQESLPHSGMGVAATRKSLVPVLVSNVENKIPRHHCESVALSV